MSYMVAIPSYKRVETLKNNTLNMLNKQNVPIKNIIIFVANKKEESIYKHFLPQYKIVVGKKGLLSQLNFIRDYFREGEHIVRIDDDVEAIFQPIHSKTKFDNGKINRKQLNKTILIDLNHFIIEAFKIAVEKGFHLWGINQTSNPFFMTEGYSTDLRLIVGAFNGMINTHKKEYDYVISTPKNYMNDDIEKTIIYYKNDGGVLRFNDISMLTKFITNEGGIMNDLGNIDNRFKKVREQNKKFASYYKSYGKVIPNTKQKEVFRLYRNPHQKIKGEGIDGIDYEDIEPIERSIY